MQRKNDPLGLGIKMRKIGQTQRWSFSLPPFPGHVPSKLVKAAEPNPDTGVAKKSASLQGAGMFFKNTHHGNCFSFASQFRLN